MSGPPPPAQTGRVSDFDSERGWGTVTADDSFAFHSTAIVDGTRMIEVGTIVAFEVVPGRMGRWEATGLRPA